VAKRLQLLHETIPAATSVGYLVNPTSPQVEARIREVGIAARVLGMRLTILRASTTLEIEAVFANPPRIDALLVDANPLFYTQRKQLTALATRHSVPSICQVRELVDAGGLVSYGTNLPDAWRLAATYVDRILKGEKPAELPVQQVTKVQLVINLKTANALGLAIPPDMLALADEVIE
jgi:putative tryptophan/tyrosine transport system substrate-binding protein